ncbi:MAG: efflux transporter outer membrane subunit [bacterium]
MPKVVERKTAVRVPSAFSRAGGAKLPERWWRAFGDPELDRLVKLALSGNPGLRAARARLDQSRALARKAGATLYPQLDAEAGISGTASKDTKSVSLVLGVAASYELDLWGRVRASRDAARLDVSATRETLRATAISLSAEVATAWYQLVERQGQLALLRRQVALNEQVLALVSFKFGQGQARAADVLQQRQLIESLRGDRSQVESQAQVLRHQLAVLAGRAPGKLVPRRIRGLPRLPPLPRAGVPARLLERRPDVRSAYYKVRAANRRVAAALADRFPRLSISASASVTGGFNPGAFYSWLTNLAANLLAPIFDGGARKAEVARSRAESREVLAGYGQVILVALREVEDALTRERELGRYLGSLDRQLRLSGAVTKQTQHSYLNGEEEYLRVLDALIKHQALERARMTVQRDLLLNRIALCRALAGGWKLHRGDETAAQGDPPRARPR